MTARMAACWSIVPAIMYDSALNKQLASPGIRTVLVGGVSGVVGLPRRGLIALTYHR